MERRIIVYLAVVFVATATLAYAALIVKNVLEVNIEGTVNVPPNPTAVDVELNIDKKEGEKTVNLGNINIPAGNLLVKPNLTEREGDFDLALSGVLVLESSKRTYRISMPCLASAGGACYRILMVIPGYDIPLSIEEGVYNVTLTLRWTAEGTGKFRLKLILQYSEEPGKACIEVVGIKPENTEDWAAASNSTRTYSMLVKKASPTSTLAWVWVFDPHNISTGKLTFRVIDKYSGSTVAEELVNAFRDGFYWSVVIEVRTPTNGKYRLTCILKDGITLNADLTD